MVQQTVPGTGQDDLVKPVTDALCLALPAASFVPHHNIQIQNYPLSLGYSRQAVLEPPKGLQKRPNVNRHSIMNPEQAAREQINNLLTKAGWNVQKSDFPDLFSHRGVAIEEINGVLAVA